MDIPHWYAVYTFPRAEKVVAQYLNLREVENFLPLYNKLSRWRNGLKVKLELPLFPGYVFVRMGIRDRLRVLQTPSVVSLVGFGSVPTPVPDNEVEVLRAQLSRVVAQPHPFLSIGDRVRVVSGPLAGLEGFLVQRKNDCRFVLSMDLLMQAMSVEIEACDVEPISAPMGAHQRTQSYSATRCSA